MMLGIMMNEDDSSKENEQKSAANDRTPQRSILDFFKSPGKVKPTKKPTNLLAYFGTGTQQKETNQKQPLDTAVNGVEHQNGSVDDKIGDKGKKRKQTDRETEEKHTDVFEEEIKNKGKKRKKCENGTISKKQDQTNDHTTVNCTADSDVKLGVDEGKKPAANLHKRRNSKELKLKGKANADKPVCENGDISKKDRLKLDKQKSIKKDEGKGQEKSYDNSENLGTEKNLTNSAQNVLLQDVSDDDNEKTVSNDSVKVNEEETVTEMCYDDFIKSLTCSDVNVDEQKTSEVCVSTVEDDKSEKSDETTAEDEKSRKDDEYIKNYPSISSFFSKVENSKTPTVPKDPKALGQVTVKADVHSEPSVKNDSPSSSTKTKSPRIYPNKDEEEIEILSSEIIAVDSFPVSKKSLFDVKTDKSKGEALDNKPGESLAEVLSSCEDSCMSEDSSVCVVEEVEDSSLLERKKCFLQSATGPDIPAKTTQVTLSFTKTGLHVQKPVKPSHSTRVRKKDTAVSEDKPAFDNTPEKKSKLGKKSGKVFNLHSDGEKIEEKKTPKKVCTPGKTSSKGGKKNEGKNTSVKEVEVSGETTKNRRKSLRSRYRVAIIDAKDGKTPIRMKFNRYSKSSSSGVEEVEAFTPRSTKQTKKNMMLSKAKELLEKAKQKKGKTKKAEKKSKSKKKTEKKDRGLSSDDAQSSSRRRSARLSDKFANESFVVVDSEDSGDEKPKVKARGSKSTPGKPTPSKATPSKSKKIPGKPTASKGKKTPVKTGKLASIFLSGKAAKEEKKPAVVLDPEAEKLRRAFLMSGVPEELRRQTNTADVMILEDYPPLPTINHTQQREPHATSRCGTKLWDLPSVQIPQLGKDVGCLSDKRVEWQRNLVSSDSSVTDCSHIRDFQKHVQIEDGEIEKVLAEISTFCPSYPIRKVFTVLKEKRDDFEQEAKEAEQMEKKPVEEKSHEKAAPRRSLRRKRVSLELPEVVELGGSPPPTVGNTTSTEDTANKQDMVPTVSWTDKYLPLHSCEVVGNTAKVRKLHSWLVEWKQRLDKEARKAKKLQMKQNKSKQGKEQDNKGDWWDDDSDFALDSDDSDEEEDRLCNTVMLCGPSGIGKTATVYGLAHELGFKVFEVNASSTRNGKRILAQLQEATQSHQVSRNTDTPTKCPPSKTGSTQPSVKIPSAFSTFFKQMATNSSKPVSPAATGRSSKGKGKSDKESGRKKRKRDMETEDLEEKKAKHRCTKSGAIPVDPKTDGSLNLSSTSLILFEEVDVVFPSDHGFWSAVQHFMATTKIPIILTTSDTGLVNQFDGRFDHCRFKTPSYRTIALYLQLVCLAEHVRTGFWDMYSLVSLCCGDIRRCLHSLQYWVLSGGGINSVKRSIHGALNVPTQTESSAGLPDNGKSVETRISIKESPIKQAPVIPDDEDDDDFVCLKPVCQKRSGRLISDDESSNSMPPVPLTNSLDLVGGGTSDAEQDKLPLVQLGHTGSLQGLQLHGHNTIMSLVQKMLETDDDRLVSLATRACRQYRSLKCDLLYRHHLSLLPLSKVESLPPTLPMAHDAPKKTHRRIKTFDLYDSETSNDGQEQTELECEASLEKLATTTVNPRESLFIKNSLNSFHRFYDDVSFTDCMAALDDRLSSRDMTVSGVLSEYCSDVQLLSCRRLYKTHSEMRTDILSSEYVCVPITTQGMPRIEDDQGQETSSTSGDTPTCRANSNVRTSLPLGLPTRGVHQEYLPTLRTICKSEQLREQAKIKRRFQHYLDGIGLTLKENTLSVLCTTFQ